MKTAQYTKSLTVSLQQEVYDRIKQITDDRQISIGEWVRDAIDNTLANNNREEENMK
jgi:metal-responsive CopG/Arc/MetJ family transcriptional regulator